MEENRVILSLDVSTKCIGVAIVEDDGISVPPRIIAMTHKSPKIPKNIKDIEALFLRKYWFDEGFLKNIYEYTDKKITDVVIEEPLLSSNNVDTVGILLKFNGMIGDAVYNTLGLKANFISSYDARVFSFPQLVSLRKYNKHGYEYPIEHIKNAIKKNNLVLFGSYPFDIDKKNIMMNMVNDLYIDDKSIPWDYNKMGELKKENYDACDALVCALSYININRYGVEKPKIIDYDIQDNNNEYIINYTTNIWDKNFSKTLILQKQQ